MVKIEGKNLLFKTKCYLVDTCSMSAAETGDKKFLKS